MNIDGRNSALIGSPFATLGTSFSSANINSNIIYVGHSFHLFEDKSISEVSIRINTKTGTVVSGDIEMHIQEVDMSTGYPNGTDLGTTSTSGTFTAGLYTVFTFSTPVSLTAGKQYCWYIKNLNAAPTTNYIGWSYMSVTDIYGGSTSLQTERRLNSTNSGTSWARSNYSPTWRISFSDDTDIGIPMLNLFTSSVGQDGVGYQTPKGVRMKLRQVLVGMNRVGSYTSTVTLTLRKASDYDTIIATSHNIYDFADLPTTGSTLTSFYFSDVVLEPDTIYVFVKTYVTGSAGVGMYNGALEDTLGLRIRQLTKQIGGLLFSGSTNLSDDTTRDHFVIQLALVGEYEQPFYPQSSIKPS